MCIYRFYLKRISFAYFDIYWWLLMLEIIMMTWAQCKWQLPTTRNAIHCTLNYTQSRSFVSFGFFFAFSIVLYNICGWKSKVLSKCNSFMNTSTNSECFWRIYLDEVYMFRIVLMLCVLGGFLSWFLCYQKFFFVVIFFIIIIFLHSMPIRSNIMLNNFHH